MCALCAERASAEAAAAASIENARTAVAGGDDAVGNGRVASEKWRERERPSDYRSQPNTQLTAIRKLARGRVADKKDTTPNGVVTSTANTHKKLFLVDN